MSSAQQWAVVLGGRFGVIITHVPAVLLSQKTGRPVRVQMTREEEFIDGRPAPRMCY